MNAILLWIGLPIVVAGLLFLLQEYRRFTALLGSSVALILAGLAWAFPVGKIIRLFSWNIEITGQIPVLGSQIILAPTDRPLLILFYSMAAFWFLGSLAANVPAQFVPLGLFSTALIILGISVEPFFYAAILFEFVALSLVILLSPSGRPPTKGVLRFLIFQTLGMLLILFAGWSLPGFDPNNVNITQLKRSLILLGLGFAFMVGIFPFLTWFPMLAHRNNIYLTAFVFNLFLNGILIFGLDVLNQYTWMSTYFDLERIFRIVGSLMLATGGLLAVFQNHLGRVLGYAMIAEIGRSLLSISLGSENLKMYFAFLILQTLTLGLWSLALDSLYARTKDLDFEAVAGLGRRLPFPVASLLLAQFSLAGVPLLGGFPLYWSLGSRLTQQVSFWPAVWLLLGGVGFVVGGMRALNTFILRLEDDLDLPTLKTSPKTLLILGGIALPLSGVLVQYLVFIGQKLATAF